MKKALSILTLLIFVPLALALALGQNAVIGNGTFQGPVTATVAATWQQITLPANQVSNGGWLFPASDGYVYSVSTLNLATCASTCVTTISRTPLSGIAGGSPTWTSLGTITAASCTNCGTEGESFGSLIATPNGTIFLSIATAAGTIHEADVMVWNGSTVSPSWSAVSGYTPSSSFPVYVFSMDSSNLVYLFNGDGFAWQETATNVANFNLIASNVYNAPVCGGNASGGVYAHKVFSSPIGVNAGSAPDIWAGGEQGTAGGLLNFNIGFTTCVNYLVTPAHTGNIQSIAAALPAAGFDGFELINDTTSASAGVDGLAIIDLTTGSINQPTCTVPWVPPSCPTNQNDHGIDSLNLLYGQTFVWSFDQQSSFGRGVAITTNSGVAWADLTTMGTTPLGSSCTGGNMEEQSHQSYQPPHDVFSKCQSGKIYWHYGPA